MKNLRLVIGIVVILAIVCSPALAISMSDLIAQYQPTTSHETLDFRDIPCNCDGTIFERHRAPNYTVIQNIAVPIPTTIPTKPTPTPSPSTLDIYVDGLPDSFPATLIPSYYEYSKFPAPKPCISGPPPGMSDEEYWEMLARASERLYSGPMP
jgi:hypothetical protein